MMTTPLGKLLDQLADLTFDDLLDLEHRIAFENADADKRPAIYLLRRGLAGGGMGQYGDPDNFLRNPAALWVWKAFTALKKNDREAAEKVIKLLRSALEPKRNRRRKLIVDADGKPLPAADRPPAARGAVQVKTIRGQRYVYIRYSVSAGGADKLEKRFKNCYVLGSKHLATALDALDEYDPPRDKYHPRRRTAGRPLEDAILDAYNRDTETKNHLAAFVSRFNQRAQHDPSAVIGEIIAAYHDGTLEQLVKQYSGEE